MTEFLRILSLERCKKYATLVDPQNVENLLYGRSITDSCISIQETYDIIKNDAYLRI